MRITTRGHKAHHFVIDENGLITPHISVIGIDNVLWGGKVLDPSVDDADTVALRELNAWIVADNRVEVVMLSVGDGLTLVRRI